MQARRLGQLPKDSGLPVAAHPAVLEDDRIEQTRTVVGPVALVRIQDDIAALVADEILVVRRQEDKPALPEAPGTAVCVNMKGSPGNAFRMQFASQQVHCPTAVGDSQPGPPDEVLEGCRRMAPEIFPCKQREGIVPVRQDRFRPYLRADK